MTNLLKAKKTLISMSIAIFCLWTYALPASAMESFGPWKIWATHYGDYDGAYVFLGSGVDDINVTVKQIADSVGFQAKMRWKIVHTNTGVTERSQIVNGDFYGTLMFTNLAHPGGNYQVIWESLTENDLDNYSWFQVHIPSGFASQ